MEITQINNPVSRELQGQELSELVDISSESIFQALHSILEKQQRRKNFQDLTFVDKEFQTVEYFVLDFSEILKYFRLFLLIPRSHSYRNLHFLVDIFGKR